MAPRRKFACISIPQIIIAPLLELWERIIQSTRSKVELDGGKSGVSLIWLFSSLRHQQFQRHLAGQSQERQKSSILLGLLSNNNSRLQELLVDGLVDSLVDSLVAPTLSTLIFLKYIITLTILAKKKLKFDFWRFLSLNCEVTSTLRSFDNLSLHKTT